MHPMNARLLKKVESLLELDEDEIRSFDMAVNRCEDAALRAHLQRLRDDHRRHIEELLATVARYGARPSRRSSVKDGLFDRLSKLRGATGLTGALKALEDREQRMRQRYTDLLAEGELPFEIANVVRRCRDDEVRHVAEIRDFVAGRSNLAPGAH